MKIKIGERNVGEGEPVLIIAEVGINHNGDFETAKKMVDMAADCGVDAVKFQKRVVEDLFVKSVLESEKQTEEGTVTYREYKEKGELSEEEFIQLKEYTEGKGLMFFASPWDLKSADFIESLGVEVHKIASALLTDLPLLEKVAKFGKPMIVSTALSSMEEVERAVKFIEQFNKEILLMHCVGTYPTEVHDVNLRTMDVLREKFPYPVGYSGHENGIAISEAAVAMGAVAIERHFTLDRTMPGPDQAASLEAPGLKKLVRDIRTIEEARGTGKKELLEPEVPIKAKLSKSIVACEDIKKGTVLTPELISTKSPGKGLLPLYMDDVINKKLKRDLKADDFILKEDVE